MRKGRGTGWLSLEEDGSGGADSSPWYHKEGRGEKERAKNKEHQLDQAREVQMVHKVKNPRRQRCGLPTVAVPALLWGVPAPREHSPDQPHLTLELGCTRES